MVRLLVLFIAFAFSFNLWCSAAEKNDLQNSSTNYTIINSEVHFPEIVMQGIESEIEIFIDDPNIKDKDKIEISINQIKQTVPITNGKGVILHTFEQPEICTITIADESYEKDIHPIPLWLSVIPPLIAILMALIFREVYSSLFIGLLFGSLTISLYADTSIFGFFTGLYAIIDQYIIAALTNRGHVSIIVFSMLIGGMVGIITKNGGMKGIVN
ncbi:MAG: hypothetical protein C0594_02400 [Marinilabiliales bacterium]|nr:MAG: hypothetical protein C0594_02400 [Marinilabiliales bacterium]